MLVSEAKEIARALIGFETYDTEPSALLKFIQDGVRVVGQALLDANPWLFASSITITPASGGAREFELTPTAQPSLSATPLKILTVGRASQTSGTPRYQWVPALQPVEVMSKSPDAGGYSQPYQNGFAYTPPYLWFASNIGANEQILVIYAWMDSLPTADTDHLFGDLQTSLTPYDYLVPYHAAMLMGLQRGEDIRALQALYLNHLERITATVKDMQAQALNHIPQFGQSMEV